MSLISVTILTGFLGAGKTTLLKRILGENHGQKIAVIENEFGEENIDSDILISDNDEQIIQMTNGCICCSIREDLRSTLNQLAAKRHEGELDFERVVIETTGVADPGPVAQTFFMDQDVAANYVLDGILTLVDAKHAKHQLDERQEARRQVGFADALLISKSDLVSEVEITHLISRLQQMNPRAPIDLVHFGNVAIDKVLGIQGFNMNTKLETAHELGDHSHCEHDADHCVHVHHHQDDVKSFVFRANTPFDPAKLELFFSSMLQVYGQNMLRYKGVLDMTGTDRKVIFQGVHQVMGSDLGPAWKNDELRESKIVFIGIDLPQKVFIEGLNQALIEQNQNR